MTTLTSGNWQAVLRGDIAYGATLLGFELAPCGWRSVTSRYVAP